jgi:biotin carboxylase
MEVNARLQVEHTVTEEVTGEAPARTLSVIVELCDSESTNSEVPRH